MASKSMQNDSDHESVEQWDDMAIVRAFEEALSDQRSHSSTSLKAIGRKQKSEPNGNTAARKVATDEEDGKLQGEGDHPASSTAERPDAGACTGHAASPFTSQQQQQYQQSDLYQAAYAQAYAQLQAQFQTLYPAPTPQPYRVSMQAPTQSPYYSPPPPPPIPSVPTPFPGMPAAQCAGPAPCATETDDGLANVLMAWYQSGYYTGRFQAMQEMKLRGHR